MDEYPQSPEQVTLTHQWTNTVKRGRDDLQIAENSKKALAARKKKKEKVFVHSGRKRAIAEVEEVELSELLQPEVMDAVVDVDDQNSVGAFSNDSAFSSKLILPACKQNRSLIPNSEPKTKKRNKNPDSRLVKDLNAQIILQEKVIADLRHKLSLISDISNESKVLNKKDIQSKISALRPPSPSAPLNESPTNLHIPPSSKEKHVINLHIY